MRALRFVLASVLILGLPAVVAAGDDKLMEEVRAIGDALSEDMIAGDVESMLDMYAEDAISLPNNGPRMDGIDEFRAHHKQMETMGMKVTSFESEPTDVWKAGDQVIEIGTYKIALEMPGMGEITDAGKYMTVYVRDKKGELKIKAETWNTDMNPMEMAAQAHE